MWESLLTTFQIQGEITYPAHAAHQLVRYESEIGVVLPDSYKSFCSVFGPGELVPPVYYLISVPGAGTWDNLAESRKLHSNCLEATSECPHYLSNDADIKRLRSARFFGKDRGSYCYFWNLDEITVAEQNEYAIYMINRSCKMFRLCDTFADFVNRICLVEGVPGDDPATHRERIFISESYNE